MKIPIITKLLKSSRRKRFRRITRGYRILKKSNHLDKVSLAKEAITNTKLDTCEGHVSKNIFQAGIKNAEIIIRQYLLIRIGGLNFNRALLYSIGKAGSKVVHPLPPEWRDVLCEHGFKVARLRSTVAWYGFVALMYAYGAVTIVRIFFAGIKEVILPSFPVLGRYAYFCGLSAGNLPQPSESGKSHDIVSWYQQWQGRLTALDTFCHDVKGVKPVTVERIPVISIQTIIPPLNRLSALVRYFGWGILVILVALIDLIRGRWWHALMLNQAATAMQARLQVSENLARVYLLHNSGWIYRPLWTYETEKKGSQITFYFYSTNCEPFRQSDGYPKYNNSWQVTTWPHHLVWDKYQADFIRRSVGENAKINIVGPIWFSASSEGEIDVPMKAVAVFDVQPLRDAYYQTLGLDFEYYTIETSNQFLADIYEVAAECGGIVAHKRKRNVGTLVHPKYRNYIKKMEELPDYHAIEPGMSATKLINECIAVISMPFTSTALIGRDLGKPSVYYDPLGLIQKNDRGAHDIQIISGPEDLRDWLAGIDELRQKVSSAEPHA